ncbi:amidohydrolase family protein [candidate division KSB1 bacterium]|nr:amidohydrolase family protein [candidate division KSB1 bacterium]
MIIDVHAHVFLRPLIRFHPDATPFMSAEQQLAVMDQLGIDKAVILPLLCPEVLPEGQSLDEILQICSLYPERFIPFCNIDPRLTSSLYSSDIEYYLFLLEQFRQFGCRGLGELTAKVYWDDPKLVSLLRACSQIGFPVIFHTSLIGTSDYGPMDDLGFPRLRRVLSRLPDLKLIGHSMAFWSEISGDVTPADKTAYPSGAVRPGGKVVEMLATFPNLYADLSANSGYNALARDPEFAFDFIERFQDKLLMGLDYCSPKNERPLVHWLRNARDEGKISQTAFVKVVGENAMRFLHIDSQSPGGCELSRKSPDPTQSR